MNLPQCPQGCIPFEIHKTAVVLDLATDDGVAQYLCIRCGWSGQLALENQVNPSFIFNSIAKYNRVQRQTQKDVILNAVGIHAGLLPKKGNPLPVLSQEERDRVLYFLKQFLASQKLEVTLKE